MQTRVTHLRSPVVCLLTACLISVSSPAAAPSSFETGWTNPPVAARVRAYWWWLNGNVTKAAITRDLEEMKAKGFGGALICDADGSSQDGNDRVPHGPTFLTPEWRELYKHALREADRLGLEMSLNIQSGWNLGGPMVTAEDAAKKLVWSETQATGPTQIERQAAGTEEPRRVLPRSFVVAYRPKPAVDRGSRVGPLAELGAEGHAQAAALLRAGHARRCCRNCRPQPGEEDTRAADVLDLTAQLDQDGTLRWDVPAGAWQVLRFGYTIGDHCPRLDVAAKAGRASRSTCSTPARSAATGTRSSSR